MSDLSNINGIVVDLKRRIVNLDLASTCARMAKKLRDSGVMSASGRRGGFTQPKAYLSNHSCTLIAALITQRAKSVTELPSTRTTISSPLAFHAMITMRLRMLLITVENK